MVSSIPWYTIVKVPWYFGAVHGTWYFQHFGVVHVPWYCTMVHCTMVKVPWYFGVVHLPWYCTMVHVPPQNTTVLFTMVYHGNF